MGYFNSAINFRNDCTATWCSSLKKLFYARQSSGNIDTYYAPCMKSAQSELSSRLTDALGSDNSYSGAKLYSLLLSQVPSIAVLTNAKSSTAAKRRPNLYPGNACLDNSLRFIFVNFFITINNDCICTWINNLACR